MIPYLRPLDPFPPVDSAREDMGGLLAVGGSLAAFVLRELSGDALQARLLARRVCTAGAESAGTNATEV